jgi:hypothetical protein
MHHYLFFPLYPYSNTFRCLTKQRTCIHTLSGIRTVNQSRPLSTALGVSAPASRVMNEQITQYIHTISIADGPRGRRHGRVRPRVNNHLGEAELARPVRTIDEIVRRGAGECGRGRRHLRRLLAGTRLCGGKMQFVIGVGRKGATRSAVPIIALLPPLENTRQSASCYRGGVGGGRGGGLCRWRELCAMAWWRTMASG